MVTTSFEGENYSGRFNIEEKRYSWVGGNSEVGDRNEVKYWYEGIGDIKNIRTGEVEKFVFKSKNKRDKNFGSLDEVFGTNIDSEKVVNLKGIYDLILEGMYLRSKEESKHEATIIPEVTPEYFSEKELFNAKLIKNPSHLESMAYEI